MDEREWLTCDDPKPMLDFLRDKFADRKFRLFQVACCRRIWSLLPDEACREAVLVAERYADGQANDRQRRAIQKQMSLGSEGESLTAINARSAAFRANEKTTARKTYFLGVAAVLGHAANLTGECGTEVYKATYRAEQRAETDLIRCLFGNPFRPVALASAILAWNDGLVARLAQAAYDERHLPSGTLASGRLAVLADALQEAGSEDADLLGHLRGPGQHWRGCWPVDFCLGRS